MPRLSMASRPVLTRAASTDSTVTTATNEAFSSNSQSLSSTPPTSAADNASIDSTVLNRKGNAPSVALKDPLKVEGEGSSAHPRRTRHSAVETYNLKILSGTAVHAPHKFSNRGQTEDDASMRRRTISGDTLVGSFGTLANSSSETIDRAVDRLARDEGVEAMQFQWSPARLPTGRSQTSASSPKRNTKKLTKPIPERRISTRSSGAPIEDLAKKLSVLGKRGRNAFEAGLTKAKRELKRLADTDEFAHIDKKPVVHTVWANGKFVVPGEAIVPARKRAKIEGTTPTAEPEKGERLKSPERKIPISKGPKKWLEKGLYAGQGGSFDWANTYTKDEKKAFSDFPEYRPNGFMPLPMWHGQRLLHVGRDFKLPFDVCNPLPPGQPKPDEWRRMPKNRFVGDAAAAWKKSTLFDDFSSRCICTPVNGCDDSCQNRIMLYECDSGNCAFGKGHCSNRAFADLQERRKEGGRYRIGVEVIKTVDRGYGVRSNRCFDANQIITEYTGEIITEAECDRRMNEEYKNNDCYYLMSFDQNTILDATEKGSIARFVNHSCDPNCRMVKWVVAGKPRMALFAGDRPIMTGEELTYDYNFDPFSAKNVQECHCGSANCRGILGPRPKDQKIKPAGVAAGIKRAVNAGKRKLQQFLAGGSDENQSPTQIKKRKIAKLAPIKTTTKALETVRGLKRTLSKTLSTSLSTKNTSSSKQMIMVKKRSKASTLKTYGKTGKQKINLSSRNSSLTVVAADDDDLETMEGKRSKGKKKTRVPRPSAKAPASSPPWKKASELRRMTGKK